VSEFMTLPALSRKQFHVFSHLGYHYILGVETMTAARIGAETACRLEDVENGQRGGTDAVWQDDLVGLNLGFKTGESEECSGERRGAISHAVLFLTQRCNLRCTYCYGAGGGYGHPGEMRPEVALRAVDWLIEQSGSLKKLSLQFFGGEPLLQLAELREITLYAKEKAGRQRKEISFSITTNGSLLDDGAISFLKEMTFRVTVSFDGPQDVQDAQRPFLSGKGSYARVAENVKKLLAVMPESRCRPTLTNGGDARRIRDSLREAGFCNIGVGLVSPSLFSNGRELFQRGVDGVLDLMEDESREWIAAVLGRDAGHLRTLRDSGILHEAIAHIHHGQKKSRHCLAGSEMVAISCLGDIFPCHRFTGQEGYRMGNVTSGEFQRKGCAALAEDYGDRCKECFARNFCAGGCKHDNLGMTGSPLEPAADMCRVERRKLELAAWVCCNLKRSDFEYLLDESILPPKPCPIDFP
jgi:uncharacterized protein